MRRLKLHEFRKLKDSHNICNILWCSAAGNHFRCSLGSLMGDLRLNTYLCFFCFCLSHLHQTSGTHLRSLKPPKVGAIKACGCSVRDSSSLFELGFRLGRFFYPNLRKGLCMCSGNLKRIPIGKNVLPPLSCAVFVCGTLSVCAMRF